jgi:hypothetical protein
MFCYDSETFLNLSLTDVTHKQDIYSLFDALRQNRPKKRTLMWFIVILRLCLKITMNHEKSFFNNEGAERPMLHVISDFLRNISHQFLYPLSKNSYRASSFAFSVRELTSRTIIGGVLSFGFAISQVGNLSPLGLPVLMKFAK